MIDSKNPLIQGFLFLVVLGSMFVKFSFAFGAYSTTFSGLSLIAPLIACCFAFKTACCLALVLFFSKFFGYALVSSFGLPTLAAVACWHSFDKKLGLFARSLIFLGIPAFSAFLFITHEIGFYACWYTFYWLLIPLGLLAHKEKPLWLNSLFLGISSSFVTHAVGSVLWLYTFQTEPQFWYSLIPIVFAERLFFAFAMFVLYLFVVWVRQGYKIYITTQRIKAVR